METATILLRRWRETDAEALYKYASDPEVGPRAGWPAHRSVEESLEIIRSVFANDSTWAIVLRETGEAIGCIGYYTHAMSNIDIGTHDCEVGYWLGHPYWNRGICTEALRLMVDYCVNVMHFDNIYADHFTGNPASGRAASTDAANCWAATARWSGCTGTAQRNNRPGATWSANIQTHKR